MSYGVSEKGSYVQVIMQRRMALRECLVSIDSFFYHPRSTLFYLFLVSCSTAGIIKHPALITSVQKAKAKHHALAGWDLLREIDHSDQPKPSNRCTIESLARTYGAFYMRNRFKPCIRPGHDEMHNCISNPRASN